MSDPLPPAKAVSLIRRIARRVGGTDLMRPDQAADCDAPPRPPIIAVTRVNEQPAEPEVSATAYAAQIIGQGGQKRGLRGGPDTLDRARATYLETEWSGPADRRIRRGVITKTEI